MLAISSPIRRSFQTLVEFLVARRRMRSPWLLAAPAGVVLLFSGPPWQGAGIFYFILGLLTVLYGLRPMVVVWLPLFVAFLLPAVVIAVVPESTLGSRAAWPWLLWFAVFQAAPAIALWVARPRGVEPTNGGGKPA